MTEAVGREGGDATAEFGEWIPDARRALRRERRILRAEADAFGRFCRRLAAVDVDAESVPAQSGSVATLAERGPVDRGDSPAGAAIRDAYTGTVMDTPHYAAEYGDAYWESVASEFGAELAMALRQAARVTPLLRDQLLAAARKSKRSRKRLLGDIADETDALGTAERALGAVREDLAAVRSRPLYGCSPRELRRLLADLDGLEADCQALAVRRQRGDLEPKTVRVPGGAARPVNEYLYQPLSSSHPVLSAVGRTSDDVVTAARRIRRVLSAERENAEIGE